MPEWLLSTLVAAACGSLGGFIGVRVGLAELRVHVDYLRRDVDSAHKRLDAAGAPPGHAISAGSSAGR